MEKMMRSSIVAICLCCFQFAGFGQGLKIAPKFNVETWKKGDKKMKELMKADSTAGREHDWKAIEKEMQKEFSKNDAGLFVIDAQIRQARKRKDTDKEILYTVQKIDTHGFDTSGIGFAILNNVCYDLIFNHSSDKKTLIKAAGWMDVILKGHTDDHISVDTYANLLYKSGKKDEAIAVQEKAWKMEKDLAEKEKREASTSIKETLEKMKKGMPTWETK